MKTLAIAGLRIVFECPETEVFESLTPPYYSLFRSEEPDAQPITVQVRPGVTQPPGSGRSLFRMGDSWALLRDGPRYYFVVEPENPAGPIALVLFNPASQSASITYNESIAGSRRRTGQPIAHPFEYPVDRMLLTYFLGYREGLFLHSLGGTSGAKGCLFPGLSGAGKSTLARILDSSSAWRVLSDERCAVRHFSGRFSVFGTPWPGEAGLASPMVADLKAVVFLRHSSSNQIQPVEASEAVKRLLSLATVGWYDPDLMSRQLTVVERLVGSVPCYELRFVPDQSVLRVLDDLVAKG